MIMPEWERSIPRPDWLLGGECIQSHITEEATGLRGREASGLRNRHSLGYES